MKALIDTDVLVYRTCYTKIETGEVDESMIKRKFSNIMDNMMLLDLPDIFEWQHYLTGKGNFRVEAAVTAPYKGGRKSEKPPFYYELREYVEKEHGAEVVQGMEADDMLAIEHYKLTNEGKDLDNAIIVTVDKDLDQVVGWHFNPTKKERYFLNQKQANLRFYSQFLEGDRVDNIIGAKGIGKVKAKKLLEDKSEREQWSVVVEHLGMERALENGTLLYMLRTVDDSFTAYLDRQGFPYERS